ncbi:Aste57867_25136 [Aphanomyces stellatus]|uniref:Aste57867_25136 protein n=1 Tax=Aphanomyces stellatus TaxID=120398 RepID=A0A485LSC4_9STRA|nr:hypothetical protein As57867_025058 [Aphanomyces stellatus]VFU01766.1 Aste57867_25136 [Aphanomyces stellatus]
MLRTLAIATVVAASAAASSPVKCTDIGGCIAVFEPVCGSDNRTYGNACELTVAQCSNPSLQLASDGACGDKCQLKACADIYAPVCGSDGQTYGNKCELQRAQCNNKPITVVSQGPCGNATTTQPANTTTTIVVPNTTQTPKTTPVTSMASPRAFVAIGVGLVALGLA